MGGIEDPLVFAKVQISRGNLWLYYMSFLHCILTTYTSSINSAGKEED